MRWFIILLIPTLLYSQNNIDDEKLKYSIEQICQGKYPYFHKAHSFYFEHKIDSAYLYCSKASISSKKQEINDYLNFIYGVCAYSKKFDLIAQNKFSDISFNFPYYYLLNYNLGGISLENEEFQKALSFYNKAIASQQIKSNAKLKIIYHNIGICHLHLKQFNKAKGFLKKEIEVSKQDKDTIGVIYAKLDFGNIYYEQYKDDIAIGFFEEAYNLSTLISDFNVRQVTSENLAIVEKNRGNFKNSMTYFEKSMMWKDSIWNRDKISLLME
ncbi:MAG: hypothetical protein GKR88_13805 [Flavobacteriaceae bacterium]|nr:MAG: hypothetical protein GKR88_13805 [Flavobacteriaceae bacterium]